MVKTAHPLQGGVGSTPGQETNTHVLHGPDKSKENKCFVAS